MEVLNRKVSSCWYKTGPADPNQYNQGFTSGSELDGKKKGQSGIEDQLEWVELDDKIKAEEEESELWCNKSKKKTVLERIMLRYWPDN